MKWIKRLLKFAGILLLLLAIVIAGLITTQDDTPLEKTDFYHEWKQTMEGTKTVVRNDTLYAGWSKVNFTPDRPGPMAGYGKRKGKPFTQVHDSVSVRSVVFKNGNSTAAIVSADLLIIPPTVTARLRELLTGSDIPFANVYLGATHTHNSVGGWGTGISGLFFSGTYDPEVEDRIAAAIVESLRESKKKLEPVQMAYKEAYNRGNIRNRLIGDEGVIDPEIRAFELVAASGKKLTLATFGAHSTVLSSGNMALSRDWPGVLLDSLDATHFGIYLAGAVGSMGPKADGKNDFESMVNQGSGVFATLKSAVADSVLQKPALAALTLPLPLGDPNPRITTKWALRSVVFNKLFGEYPNEIKALRLGDVLMVGVPCDFSGELMAPLDRYAKTKGLNLIVTSFNGGYIGYVTDDRWYSLDKYETMTMNWYGPFKGAYFREVIKDLIDLLD